MIANSIKEFGFNQPLVVDEDFIVLVGHGRLEAAQKLGLKKVPVYQIKGLSELQKKAYRILDNKLQNDSEWDIENLNLELNALQEMNFEFVEFGLDDLVKQLAVENAPPEPRSEPVSESTEYECPECGHVWSGKAKA
jgi:ParB-like chromosome segregation protein Spo0J